MGALIPNGNDAEVIDELNKTFSGRKLKKLRKHIHDNRDDMFAEARHLHRISHRLKIHPTSGPKAKGRWYVFLRDLVGAANQKKILKAIRDAVNDPTCAHIKFWARLDPGVPNGYDVEVVPGPPDTVTITLLCDHEIDPSVPGDPSKPPADTGEAGPEQPDLDSAAAD
jgi:hypothetical protein